MAKEHIIWQAKRGQVRKIRYKEKWSSPPDKNTGDIVPWSCPGCGVPLSAGYEWKRVELTERWDLFIWDFCSLACAALWELRGGHPCLTGQDE